MATTTRATDILLHAEKAVATLVTEAGQAREYEEASRLIDLARGLQQLAANYSSAEDAVVVLDGDATKSLVPISESISQLVAIDRKRSRRGEYPKFFRD